MIQVVRKIGMVTGLIAVLALLLPIAEQAFAQSDNGTTGKPPKRIQRPMVAIDPITLQADGLEIHLWGIKPAASNEIALELKALEKLDEMIGNEPVSCRVMAGRLPEVWAKCTASTGTDLGMTLLQEGLAVVDRRQTFKSVFASAYVQAQDIARAGRKGVWRLVAKSDQQSNIPQWLEPMLPTLIPLALVFGPLIGLGLIAFVTWQGFARLAAEREREFSNLRRKEQAITSRERLVVITALEGELLENKNKTEAYISIYEDMKRDIESGDPKYKQAGDIVQKSPSLSKSAYEANMARLQLLDMKVSSGLSKLYASFPSTPEYINLEPTVPEETALQLLDKMLTEARELLPAIDSAVALLQRELDQKAPE